MIMGADVCHKVAGISVAAVVGSTDGNFDAWRTWGAGEVVWLLFPVVCTSCLAGGFKPF